MTIVRLSLVFAIAIVAALPALAQAPRQVGAAPGSVGTRLLRIPGSHQPVATTTGGCAAKPVRVVYAGYGEASPMPSCPQTFSNGNYSQPDGDRAPQ